MMKRKIDFINLKMNTYYPDQGEFKLIDPSDSEYLDCLSECAEDLPGVIAGWQLSKREFYIIDYNFDTDGLDNRDTNIWVELYEKFTDELTEGFNHYDCFDGSGNGLYYGTYVLYK